MSVAVALPDVGRAPLPIASEAGHHSFWGWSSLARGCKCVLFYIVNGDSDVHSATSVA